MAYVVASVHPPWPVVVIFLMFAGLGNGLEDGAWNAWIGNMEKANELLGFLHAAYGLGAASSYFHRYSAGTYCLAHLIED